jgi:hypothetical protein
VADHQDVPHLEYLDRVLHGGEAVHVRRIDQVGDIAMNEHLTREQTHDLIGRNPGVGASYPEELRSLLMNQAFEKARIPRDRPRRPPFIVFEQFFE